MSIGTAAASAALKAVAKFGATITLTRLVAGVYDAATGTVANTATAQTVKAILEDYKGFDLANGLANAGDKKVSVAASGLTIPALGDQLTIVGITYAIVGIQTIMAGDTAALYVLQARKS